MKKVYLLIVVLIIGTSAFSQTGKLKGKVMDMKTNLPLIGVAVTSDEKVGTTSDLDGFYELELNSGEHKITYHFVGYTEQSKRVTIKENETITINILLEEADVQLPTMVVSAGKYEQNISDVTVSMQVVKPAMIQGKNTTSMETIIDQIPGVTVTDNQASIRGGSGWSYGAGSRLVVMVDDMPMLAADAGDVKWSFMPVENIEQVEVIAGASSASYGAYALNGVINIRTGFPRDTPQTRINFFEGMYDKPKNHQLIWWGNTEPMTQGTNFYHSRKIGQLDMVVGGNFFNDEGYRQGETEQRYRLNGNFRYRFKKMPNLSVGLNFNVQYAQGGNFLLWQNDSTGAYKPFGGIDTVGSSLSNYITKRSYWIPYIKYFDENGNSFKLSGMRFNTTNLNTTNQESISELYFLLSEYHKNLKKIDANITIGAQYSYSTVHSDSLYGNHKSNISCIYGQIDKKFGKLTLSFGVRSEYRSSESVKEVTNFDYKIANHNIQLPLSIRSGLNYHLFKETFLRASYGQGYRYPTIAEKSIATHVGSIFIYPNDSLKSEVGWSTEVGIKQGFKISKWYGYFDAAYFITKYQNMMEFTFGNVGPIKDVAHFYGLGFRTDNIGYATITGLDISLTGEGKMGPFTTTFLGGFTYMNPVDNNHDSLYNANKSPSNDNFLKYRYKYIAKADLEVKYKRIGMGGSMRYNSFMHSVDTIFVSNYSPAFQAVDNYRLKHTDGDFFFDYRATMQLNKTSKVSFIIKNVFNHEAMSRPGDMLAPRSFVLQYTMSF